MQNIVSKDNYEVKQKNKGIMWSYKRTLEYRFHSKWDINNFQTNKTRQFSFLHLIKSLRNSFSHFFLRKKISRPTVCFERFSSIKIHFMCDKSS